MFSSGFEPSPSGTAVSVANHNTGWETKGIISKGWSTTAELRNHHSCRAVFSSIKVAGGGKCEDKHDQEHPKDFQWD
ncbi:hypothetical protein TNCV_4634401 [Trichonephila clavipes]|nr:hypothetical protein TNCV_4634401 [Trichonephila clavipes]